MSEGSMPPQKQHRHLFAPFGSDRFGRTSEAFARLFGTPGFIVSQTLLVIAWIAVNAAWAAFRWDPYPFILLNLAFSTQAAYAAPLILLAQTRQADRDKLSADAEARHREDVSNHALHQQEAVERQGESLRALLETNTRLVEQNAQLLERLERTLGEVHTRVLAESR